MKLNLKIYSTLLIGVIGYLILGISTFAIDDSPIGFSISPNFPSTQIDNDLGYYYLQTRPSEEQEINLKVSNQKNKTIEVDMFVEDAGTGANGSLSYGIPGQEDFMSDQSLKNAISEIVVPQTGSITLSPYEEKIVSFKISPPKENYEGIKLGQLVMMERKDSEEKNGVSEDYRMAISIMLSESGDDFENGDKLVLNDVKATMFLGKRMVVANIQNPLPKIIGDLTMKATIKEKSTDKIIKQREMENFKFAPNSNVNFEMDWGLSNLPSGEFTFNLVAENSSERIELQKEFKISSAQAKKINEESSFKIKTPIWVKVFSFINAFIFITLSIFIIIRNKKWEKQIKRRRKNKARRK